MKKLVLMKETLRTLSLDSIAFIHGGVPFGPDPFRDGLSTRDCPGTVGDSVKEYPTLTGPTGC